MRCSLRAVIMLLCVSLLAASGCGSSNKSTVAPPPGVDLDGFVFNEVYSCSQTPAGGPPAFCADDQAADTIQFFKTGSNTYQVRDVPDTGFLYTGTLAGLVFSWNATSPNGYTESGTWTFTASGESFSGSSHYVANDNSYSGNCTTNGAKAPATPPAAPPIGTCP